VALEAVARARQLPLVDASAVLDAAAGVLAAQAETRLGLAEPPAVPAPVPDKVTLVFRVDLSAEPAGRRAYVTGNSSALARMTPNTVALYDDGTHGDQRAEDGVWSLALAMRRPDIDLVYLFTDGDAPGAWRGLENYVPRVVAVRPADVGRIVLLPVEQFGRKRLRSDAVHPDAEGYRVIARALADAVEAHPAFRAYASRRAP
jgi:hypothetical protein